MAAEIDAAAVPVLDGVRQLTAEGIVPGGSGRNRADAEAFATFTVDETTTVVLTDAQTSGGLLVAVAEADVGPLLDVGVVVGRLVDGVPGRVLVA